ncbi:hypothetical protein [Streptomyces erythrochromogenes]|uniref:hypothetical protein n=1 Tax=Streptomyces erythrochromogenes TaxID=285574 RepID=UPI0036876A1E
MSAAVVVAAAAGFLPGTAHAADPSAPGVRPVAGPAKPADPKKAGAATFKTFTSGAEKSVRKGAPAAAAGVAATGNPDLKVALGATNTGAHSIQLEAAITSADATLEVSVSWGDGSPVEKLSASGSAFLLPTHV